MTAAENENALMNNEQNRASFLFYCENLDPTLITNYFFKFEPNPVSILFNFFSSIILDFLDLHTAASLLLTRCAIPADAQTLFVILDTMANVYLLANPYLSELKRKDVARVILAMMIASAMNPTISEGDFLEILRENSSYSNASLKSLYSSVIKDPFKIIYVFAKSTEPYNTNKEGFFSKTGGLFRTKKSRFFCLEGGFLRYYKSQLKTEKEQLGEIDLSNTRSSIIPASGKTAEYISIKNRSNGPVGSKIVNGQRKQSHHSEYKLFGEKNENQEWLDTLNLVSFWNEIFRLIKFVKKDVHQVQRMRSQSAFHFPK